MYERVSTLLADALYLYCIAGLFFAIAFVTIGRETYRFEGDWQRRWLSRFDFPRCSSPLAPPTSPLALSNW